MKKINIRHIEPSDYSLIIYGINEWWGGRNMVDMLPKLFFVHFRQTSFVADYSGEIVGFIVGFVSQTYSNEAYIHFAGVHPKFRKRGVASDLYEAFFGKVKKIGCNFVRCVTSPSNKKSVAFHLHMGFSIEPSKKSVGGIPTAKNYDGKGEDRVLFSKALSA